MKTKNALKKILLFSGITIVATNAFAQSIGIGTNTPNASAALEITSPQNDKGLLIPRVALLNATDDITIKEPANSLIVYNTDNALLDSGFYYNRGKPDNVNWIKLLTEVDNIWFTDGNANIDPAKFIGTTTDQSVIFKQNNEEVAQFYTGGAVVFTGNSNTGVTPVTGVGTRTMLLPEKAAFRTGRIVFNDDMWDDANIGISSFAAGEDVLAKGYGSVAMGVNAEATTGGAISMGSNTKASGLRSVAMGENTTASGNNATTFGEGTVATVRGSLAVGRYNINIPSDPNLVAATQTIFQIGNGSGPEAANRSDAFFVRRNGSAELAGMLKQNSDIRLKKDIAPLEGVISKIANIQPITYNFINTQTHPGEHQIGFSAQEVQKQFPELVSENEQGYLSVSYTNMTAVAIQAIKEQQEIIKKLEEKIAQLEKKMEKY